MAYGLFFSQVFGAELAADRCWYALTKICGIQPSKFYKDSPFVSHFPNEFKKVGLEAISSKIGAKGKEARFLFDGGAHRVGNSKENVYVSSAFGVLASVLMQKPSSSPTMWVKHLLNSLDLDTEILPKQVSTKPKEDDKKPCEFEEIKILEKEIEKLQSTLADIQAQEPSTVTPKGKPKACDDYNLPPTPTTTPPLTSCTTGSYANPTQPSSVPSKNPRIGKDNKTGVVWENIQDICGKFRQPLSTVLGQRVLGKDIEAKETVNKVVETVVGARGVKRGVEEVLGDDVHLKLLESLRVPNWVLLYFKLQARLPDQAWQTLLNLSMLGRTGVSSRELFIKLYTILTNLLINIMLVSLAAGPITVGSTVAVQPVVVGNKIFFFKICFGKLFFMCFFSIQCLQFYLTNQSTSFYFLDSWSVAKGFSPATTVLLPQQKLFFTPRSEPMYIICLWLGKAGNHFLCN